MSAKTDGKGNSIAASMMFKSLERYSVLAFQTIVQIVIARILAPSDYGLVAMMAVFISIANIFINNGFNMAIVQKPQAESKDYGTALLLNFLIGLTLYILIFFSAPYIAIFYDDPQITLCLRVLALLLPVGSISSIQSAIATREMQFKNLFICNVFGSVTSGIIGIVMALAGTGVWALIAQQLTSMVVISLALTYHATWKPRFNYLANSAREMFAFGWKMLVAGLINQVYNELNSLIIGKKYTAADLAFYTRGRQFPDLITTGVDSALQSVTLSAFSKKQNDHAYLRQLLKKTLTSNSYLLIPVLTYLAVAAAPITVLLLTEKWLPLVPYMQICCLTYAFHPMASIDMQVIAAIGRSDLRLKLEFIKKPVGILLLIVAIPYGPMAIAVSAAVTAIFSLIVGAIACERCVHYSLLQHFKDVTPIFACSAIAGGSAYAMGLIPLPTILSLLLQGIVGLVIYVSLTWWLKIPGCADVFETISRYMKRCKHE